MHAVKKFSIYDSIFILLLLSSQCTLCYTFITFFYGGLQYPQFFYTYNTFYPNYVEYEQIYPSLYQTKPHINYKGIEETSPIKPPSKPVVIEVTKVLTVNPVCVTVKDGIPPCYHNRVIYDGEYGKLNTRTQNGSRDDNFLVVGSNNKNLIVEGELEFSKQTPELKRHETFPKVITVESKNAYIIQSESIINTHPNKKFGRTRDISANTIWKTKTQKLSANEVTATLVINNCVPNELNIPKCIEIKEASEDAKHNIESDTEDFDIDIRFG